jgi:hypothetical protein
MIEEHNAGKHVKLPRQKCPLCDGPGWQLSALCDTQEQVDTVVARLKPHVKSTMTKRRKGKTAVYFQRKP